MVRHIAADARQHGFDLYYHVIYSNLFSLDTYTTTTRYLHIYDFDVKKLNWTKLPEDFFKPLQYTVPNSNRCLQIVSEVGSRIRPDPIQGIENPLANLKRPLIRRLSIGGTRVMLGTVSLTMILILAAAV